MWGCLRVRSFEAAVVNVDPAAEDWLIQDWQTCSASACQQLHLTLSFAVTHKLQHVEDLQTCSFCAVALPLQLLDTTR